MGCHREEEKAVRSAHTLPSFRCAHSCSWYLLGTYWYPDQQCSAGSPRDYDVSRADIWVPFKFDIRCLCACCRTYCTRLVLRKLRFSLFNWRLHTHTCNLAALYWGAENSFKYNVFLYPGRGL